MTAATILGLSPSMVRSNSRATATAIMVMICCLLTFRTLRLSTLSMTVLRDRLKWCINLARITSDSLWRRRYHIPI